MAAPGSIARRFRDWGRLARLSLAPTAAADVACGVVLGHHGTWPATRVPWLLLASSLCVYHGALILNDWADRERDARERPERPLPSGRIASDVALSAGAILLFGGVCVALAIGAATALWMGMIAWLAWNYTTRGRGPWMGPLLLAACRAGNLGAGLVAAEDDPLHAAGRVTATWALPVLYGVYVLVVSRLGRLEDGEDEGPVGDRPRGLLLLLAALLVGVAFVPVGGALSITIGRVLALVIAATGAAGLGREALAGGAWPRARIVGAMGRALRRLLVVTAAGACLAGTTEAFVVAGAILCGYPASWLLRKPFPPS